MRLVFRTLLPDMRAFEFVSALMSLLFGDSAAFSKKTTCLPFSLNPVGFVEDLVTARATRLFYLSGVFVVDIFSQP